MRLALLTDFGTADPYVAVMKGVLASRTDAAIHDLSHDVAPFDVFGAAWFLSTVAPWWPGTIFVCVVDPGVGTSRKIVAMERIQVTAEVAGEGLEHVTEIGEGLGTDTLNNLAKPSHRVAHSTKEILRQGTQLDRPLPPGEGRGEGLVNQELVQTQRVKTAHIKAPHIKRQLFLAPDNGLLTMIDGDCRAVSVENEAL